MACVAIGFIGIAAADKILLVPDVQVQSLAHEPNAPPPGVLTLEVFDAWARVTFPVSSPFVYWLGIAIAFFGGLIAIGEAVLEARRNGSIDYLDLALGVGAIGAAMHASWQYWRWGRVPRVLIASADGLSRSQLELTKMSHRQWPRDTIQSVELKVLKPLLSKKSFARLIVHLQEPWPLFFRLSSRDPLLPRQIAEAIAEKIGCPLVVKGRA